MIIGKTGKLTVILSLKNLVAILAPSVTVFSTHVACSLARLEDVAGGNPRIVRPICEKSLTRWTSSS